MEESGGRVSSVSLMRHSRSFLLVLLALAFGIAYSQSPLYTSNQNQYFLHGLARSGLGYLQNDWLANTRDPTPVFSFFVAVIYKIFRVQEVFHLIYLFMLGVYFVCCLGVARKVAKISNSLPTFLFIVLFILIHSSAFRFFITRATDPDWAYLFEGGLAGQRISGTVLQPSSFGIFLFLSIFLYLSRNYFLAILMAVLPAVIHPTYLLPSAMIVLAYLWGILKEEKQVGLVVKLGLIGITLAIPVIAYVFFAFRPSSPEEYARAQEILANFRIPHHAVIAEWLNLSSILQMALVLLSAYLMRKSRLSPIFIVGIGAGFLLSMLQFLTESNPLALLFPWRISSILVPLSTTILLALLVQALYTRQKFVLEANRALVYFSGSIFIGLAMAAGIYYFLQEYHDRLTSQENELYNYVEQHKQPDDVFLTPIDMQDFRLATGGAAYIDFKSIPYQDVEVLEWHRRVLRASDFYRKKKISCQDLILWIEVEGINQIVVPKDQKEPDCDFLEKTFGNESYRLFKFLP